MTFARLALAAVLAAVLFAGCGGSGDNPQTFMDRATLTADLERQAHERDPTLGDVTCVEAGERQFRCAAKNATGARFSTVATVSADGRSYVTAP